MDIPYPSIDSAINTGAGVPDAAMPDYQLLWPGGSTLRKHITAEDMEAFNADPFDSSPMMRKRADAYEGMMNIL
jgi:hypothetical protein